MNKKFTTAWEYKGPAKGECLKDVNEIAINYSHNKIVTGAKSWVWYSKKRFSFSLF
jgi:hypothetical protein